MEKYDDKVMLTPEEAREVFTSVQVHAPTLRNLRPDFQLVGMECPFDKDGHCSRCEYLQGVVTNDEAVFSYMTFEAFCSHPTTD